MSGSLPAWGNAPATTYMTTGTGAATNIREDLYDIITDTSPEECPVFTAIGDAQADAINHEWLTDELQPAGDNKQKEGGTYVFGQVKPPERLSNTCQIMSRMVSVSGSLRAVDTVGGDEYDRQMVMRALELKRDLEWRLTRDLPKVGTDPREMAGIPCFLKLGSAGAGAGALPTGDGTKGHVAGTKRDLSLDLIAEAKQQAFEKGGMPDMGVLSPALKRIFSKLTAAGGGANHTAMDNILQATEPQPATYVGAVDVYLTDFGRVEMVPDIFAPAGQLLLLDPSYIDLAPLPGRAMVEEEAAKIADATGGVVLWEGTVRVRSQNSGAGIYDLNETLTVPAPAPAVSP
jgi:hypothetical protein